MCGSKYHSSIVRGDNAAGSSEIRCVSTRKASPPPIEPSGRHFCAKAQYATIKYSTYDSAVMLITYISACATPFMPKFIINNHLSCAFGAGSASAPGRRGGDARCGGSFQGLSQKTPRE